MAPLSNCRNDARGDVYPATTRCLAGPYLTPLGCKPSHYSACANMRDRLRRRGPSRVWLPGQYFDAESRLNYNVNRNYEAATGHYLQSDPIGLVGGMNTFSYALANPAEQSDLLGLVTGVTVWQPVGWSESSFGHISTNINGTTYSFGPKGMTVIPTGKYLSKNSFRDGTEVTLNLTPKQEEMLKNSLLQPQGDYSPLKNNCGSPLQRGLKSLGIDTGNQPLPVSLGNQLLDMGVTNGTIDHAPSNPSNGTNAP